MGPKGPRFAKLLRAFSESIYTKREKKLLKNASLVGLRDSQTEFPCLPCPTCLLPIFDQVKDKCTAIHKDLPKLIEDNLDDVEKRDWWISQYRNISIFRLEFLSIFLKLVEFLR